MKKKFSGPQIVAKLRQADILIGQRKKIPEVCKEIDVSENTYYRWRQKYGGMSPDMIKQHRALQKENVRLRKYGVSPSGPILTISVFARTPCLTYDVWQGLSCMLGSGAWTTRKPIPCLPGGTLLLPLSDSANRVCKSGSNETNDFIAHAEKLIF